MKLQDDNNNTVESKNFSELHDDFLADQNEKMQEKPAEINGLDENKVPQDWKKTLAAFFSGQAISLFGSALVQYAVIWYITLETGSGLMMTISTVCGFLPQILVSVFAGVWADRINRKKLIIFSDSIIALSTLTAAILFFAGFGSMWLLFLMLGIRSFGAGIQTPAINALIPQIAPKDKLIKVNGINGSIQALIMVLSPALSGVLLATVNLEIIFFIDVFTAIIAVIILLFLKIPDPAKIKKKYFEDLLSGLKYISKNSFVVKITIYSGILMFLVVPVALLSPLLISRSFGVEEWRLAANEIAFSVGSILGGIVISYWGGFKNRVKTIILACIMFGLLCFAIGFASTFIIYLIIMFFTGIFLPFFNVPSITLLQEKVEPQMQGRVFGVTQILSAITMPLGMILFGPLSDFISIQLLMIITGSVMVLFSILMSFDKKFRKEGEVNQVKDSKLNPV